MDTNDKVTTVSKSNKNYLNACCENAISKGRFSRANVKIAPSTNRRTKANIIFPMYTKLIVGFLSSFAIFEC